MLARLLLFVVLALPVAAQDYPDYTELYVNDFADLLDARQEEAIRAKLRELRDEAGIAFTVVTIGSLSDYGHVGAIEPFATGLFNTWGIGDAQRNDGVMMLVAVSDRVMRIEVGSGYGRSKDAPMKEIIDERILPLFRQDDYAAGIDRGVDYVIHDLTGSWPGEFDAGGADRLWNRVKSGAGSVVETLGNWLLLLLAPVGVAGAFLLRKAHRNRPRICPNDGTKMERLDEFSEDRHLSKGQILEETLKSVDHDVWVCPRCDHVTVESYMSWFSSYGACHVCKFKTLHGDSTVLQAATTSSTGTRRIDYHCQHCDNRYSETKIIPSKSDSSSSSGSFDGGSSSGGGASGSW